MARIAGIALLVVSLAGCASTGRPLSDRVVPCPCSVSGLDQLRADSPRIIIRQDFPRSTSRFHPGASATYRLFDPDLDPIAGNQCAYDSSGHLIPSGPSAGTPDLVSPERSLIGHWLFDVRPFRRLGWMEYHQKGWAPVCEPDCR